MANTVHSYEKAFIQKDSEFLGKRDITLNINKEVLNVLTSFRFYVDFTNKNLHKDFGSKSEIIVKFGQCCSNEYDNNFPYRLVTQLRNYAQHKGLVVNSITFDKYFDEKDNRTIKHNLSICIDRQDLLEDKKFKKEIKTELVNHPEQIDIMEHLSKWMNSLVRIHNQLMNDLIPTGLVYAIFVVEQSNRLNYDKNDGRIGPILSAIDHQENNIKDITNPSFVPLPIEDAQRIIEYCKEHNRIGN